MTSSFTRTTRTFRVAVIERALAYYEVEAESPRDAAESWADGEFYDCDDEALDTEGPTIVRERHPDGTWRRVPPSEWQDPPEAVRFDDFEIEPRLRHWADGDPEMPDHLVCEEHEADLWRLYGTMPGRDAICIGEYPTRALAEMIYAGITGRPYPH
jgi:hypothetical protein